MLQWSPSVCGCWIILAVLIFDIRFNQYLLRTCSCVMMVGRRYSSYQLFYRWLRCRGKTGDLVSPLVMGQFSASSRDYFGVVFWSLSGYTGYLSSSSRWHFTDPNCFTRSRTRHGLRCGFAHRDTQFFAEASYVVNEIGKLNVNKYFAFMKAVAYFCLSLQFETPLLESAGFKNI